MAETTPQEAAKKWQTNAGAAQQKWSDNVQATTVDVMARAINAAQAAIAGYTQSLSSGAWARAITASGGTGNWKTKVAAKSQNYVTGINAGLTKMESAMGKLLPGIQQIMAGAPARGPAGSAANEQRVLTLIRGLHANKGSYKGVG